MLVKVLFECLNDSQIDAKTLQIARRVLLEENLRLVGALENLGSRARPITSGVFTADYLNQEKYGLVLKLMKNPKKANRRANRRCGFPRLSKLVEFPGGQIITENAG